MSALPLDKLHLALVSYLATALTAHRVSVSRRAEPLEESPGQKLHRGVAAWVPESQVIETYPSAWMQEVEDLLEVEVMYSLTAKDHSLHDALLLEDQVRRAVLSWEVSCVSVAQLGAVRTRPEGYFRAVLSFRLRRMESTLPADLADLVEAQ